MANAGQDDVDRALAAAGVPAMRYFNFRNLRFVRGPATDPVETFGVNADDHDLHVIRPPGTDAPDASPKHQPHFGYDPAPADAPHVAPPLEPDLSEAAALDTGPAHAIEEPEPVVPPPAPEPPVVAWVEPSAAEIPVVPPLITAPPVVAEVEPPPAEIPVVPPRMAEPPPVVSVERLPSPEAVSPEPMPPVLPAAEVPPPIAVAPPEPEPPVVAKKIEPTPPAPEPPPVPKAELQPPPPPAVVPAPVPAPEPITAAKVEVPPPPPPPRPPVREPPTVKVVETEAPVFDLEPAPPVAAPVAAQVAAAEPAEAGPGPAIVERESLSQMFSTLAGRAEPRPRAATWGTPEAPPDTPAPLAEPAREPAPAAAKPVPEFRMSDVRYTERAPVSPPRAVAEPKQGEPAMFSLAERLAARPDAPPPSRAEGQRAAIRTVTDAPPPRARTIPSPFQRPAPTSSAPEPPNAEALFRRL